MYRWDCPHCGNMNLQKYETFIHFCEHCWSRFKKEKKNAMEQDSSSSTGEGV